MCIYMQDISIDNDQRRSCIDVVEYKLLIFKRGEKFWWEVAVLIDEDEPSTPDEFPNEYSISVNAGGKAQVNTRGRAPIRRMNVEIGCKAVL